MVKPFDLIQHLIRQIKFSKKTFGPADRGNGLGIIDHIRDELDRELTKTPNDIEEWIDVVILAFDGAWRALGRLNEKATPEEMASIIVSMLLYKTKKNEKREWPDWRTSEPDKKIQHIA